MEPRFFDLGFLIFCGLRFFFSCTEPKKKQIKFDLDQGWVKIRKFKNAKNRYFSKNAAPSKIYGAAFFEELCLSRDTTLRKNEAQYKMYWALFFQRVFLNLCLSKETILQKNVVQSNIYGVETNCFWLSTKKKILVNFLWETSVFNFFFLWRRSF